MSLSVMKSLCFNTATFVDLFNLILSDGFHYFLFFSFITQNTLVYSSDILRRMLTKRSLKI